MPDQNQGSLQPDFDKWDIQEVKKSATQALVKNLKRSGIRGLAILGSVAGIVYVDYLLINSTLDGALKALCIMGSFLMLLGIALVPLFTENKRNATAKQRGRDSPNQSGTQPGNERTTGPAAIGNGRALNG